MIDLKAGDDEDHIRLTGLGVSQVVENIRLAASLDKLYEIRTVVVPGIVDNEKNRAPGEPTYRFLAQCPIQTNQIPPLWRPPGICRYSSS